MNNFHIIGFNFLLIHTFRGEGSGPKGDVGPKGDRGEKGNKVLEYREVIFPKGTIKRLTRDTLQNF